MFRKLILSTLMMASICAPAMARPRFGVSLPSLPRPRISLPGNHVAGGPVFNPVPTPGGYCPVPSVGFPMPTSVQYPGGSAGPGGVTVSHPDDWNNGNTGSSGGGGGDDTEIVHSTGPANAMGGGIIGRRPVRRYRLPRW